MIYLPSVTQVVIDCVDADRAALVLQHNSSVCEFADSKLLTSIEHEWQTPIPHIGSISEYSRFCLRDLGSYVDTEHVLVCQYDGFITQPSMWTDEFLQFDYIGAPWVAEQEFQVGNGGFSLRSRRLQMFMAAYPRLIETGVEDVDIAVHNRPFLEYAGFKFAPVELAKQFSWEQGDYRDSFGAHGRYQLV